MISRLQHIQQKIVDHQAAQNRVEMWKMQSNQIVFTNGCFDILHAGHVSYLAEAAQLGSKLVVALNTDSSVKRLGKGANRPINDEDARAIVIAALGCVDMVVFFDDDTPLKLIEFFQPEVLVKGADYSSEESNPSSSRYIVGSNEVKSYGGEVIAIPLLEGFSTTSIIDKLRD